MRLSFYYFVSLCVALVLSIIIIPANVLGQGLQVQCNCNGNVKCWVGMSNPNVCGPINITASVSCTPLYTNVVDSCKERTAQKSNVEIWKVQCTDTLVCR